MAQKLLQDEYRIILIQKSHNRSISKIIKTVMPEFGACGSGFAINDPEVNDMYAAYKKNKHAYFVILKNKLVLGGAGIAPLKNGPKDHCELQKMYFLPHARGLGLGSKMLNICLNTAKKMGYTHCYLETFHTMGQAMHLYQKHGFQEINAPLGKTGHTSCDRWFLKKL